MKKLLNILFLFPLIILGQNSFPDRNHDAFKYQDYVNSITDTTLVILQDENFTIDSYDGGTKLIGIFYANKLIKISTWFGLSYGINSCDYYIKNGELYFVEENFKGFKFDTNTNKLNHSEFDIRAQGWYLFRNESLLDSESLGHWRFENDSISPEKKLIMEFKEYVKLLNKS